MKFAKVLQTFVQEDEADEPFLNYKPLKKLLKKAHAAQLAREEAAGCPSSATAATATTANNNNNQPQLTPEELDFIKELNADVSRINTYFIEHEEDAVIRLRSLEDRLKAVEENDDAKRAALRADFIDFHGEVVLLLHNSMVNYAAVAKILKKHDKMMGNKLKEAFLTSVLRQPFLSTEGISRLVREAEAKVKELGPDEEAELAGTSDEQHQEVLEKQQQVENTNKTTTTAVNGSSHAAPATTTTTTTTTTNNNNNNNNNSNNSDKAAGIIKRTKAALGMLQQLRETAHTPSTLVGMPSPAGNKDGGGEGEGESDDDDDDGHDVKRQRIGVEQTV
jgi:hypothetical protein